ncbi:MAG: hypothetical protein WCJ97_01955 [Phycisphaerae bacterium]
MVTQSKPAIAYLWIWPVALVAGFLAYGCSRGSDGNLSAALVGLVGVALAYGVLIRYCGRVSVATGLVHWVVMESAVIGAMAVNPQLDEMAGMLYLILPALVAVIVVLGWLLQFVRLPGRHD